VKYWLEGIEIPNPLKKTPEMGVLKGIPEIR